MFTNMKIATKLGLSFGSILILLSIIVTISLNGMSDLSNSTQEIVKDRYAKIKLASDLIENTLDVARLVRNLLLVDDPNLIETTKKEIQISRDGNKAALAQLDPQIKSPKGRELINAVIDQRNQLALKYDTLYGLLANTDQGKQTAIDYVNKEFAQNNNALIKAIKALNTYQENLIEESAKEAEALHDSSERITWGVAFIAFLLSGLIGWLVARNLKNQLGGEPGDVAGLANKIAIGDLSSQIDLKGNDTSSVMAAMKHMTATLQSVIDEMNRMSSEHDKGDIDVKINEALFQGSYKTMVEGVNTMVFGHIAVKKKAMACIKQFGEGNLDAPMEKLPGKKVFINDTIEQLRGNLKQIVGEIQGIVAAANKGDFSIKMDLNGKSGFTKELSELLNQLSDTVDTAFKDTIYVAQALEAGDLTKTVTRNYDGAYDQVKQSLNNTVTKLSQTMGEVIAAAEQLGNASEQISATSQSLSQASSEQAASVEQTSASIEQMGASINQNSENAKVTDGMAGKANKEAVEGGVAVKQTVDAMKTIAGKIGIIDDIAYQTNMLALNAAIEAARAGDHGKGFAVVAAEVRKLAERSQVAAQEIGQLAESSVKTAEGAGQLLDAIVPSIAKTSDLVQEIAAASQEQSSGVGQINTAMNQMNQITQQNASASEELAATAEEMSGQTEQLLDLMNFFKIANQQASSRNKSKSSYKAQKLNVSNTGSNKVRKVENLGEFDMDQFQRF